MPGILHQAIARLFTDEPALGFRALREVFDLELPPLADMRAHPAVIDRFAPCFGDSGELRPDGVLSGDNPEDPHGGVGIVVEVQGRPDCQKALRMSVYWALVAESLGYVTATLVLSLSDRVSAWARALGRRELPPRDWLLVLDRQNMPVVEAVEDPERPGWLVLSAVLHAVHGDLRALRVALPAVLALEDERRWRYASYLLSAVDDEAREVLLGAMKMQDYELTDIELRSFLYNDGIRKGRAEGKAEGLAEGHANGLVEGLRELISTILELRGLSLPADLRARLGECTHVEELQRLRERAKVIGDAGALFAGSEA
ncbi:hypothetical protein G6O69_19525 [Pseudenhygromyxa sp. WMMC2535]|uniref:hypothetical protein n=1 Tax=Pseudenhygromyxa sp. WMMC2535 TaxID=2712867 RepID=UPI0015559BC3|nr:hypothetical protein [Pseudenhygromyxa sp. WMMC2535]NVB40045.1 hypothetical protein [Pseudenhygromyxa sp. WMMC2535]